METLSKLIDRAIEGGFLFGFRFKSRRGQEVCVSHLLFVDDILIFYKDNEEEMTYLSWMLTRFEASFGLKINMEKSSIILVENVESLARQVGCKVGELPTTYLGLPLGANHKYGVLHLLFVDDILIFCEDNEEEMAYLSWTLTWFEAAFGLKINMEKSYIIPVEMLRAWQGKWDARLVSSPRPIWVYRWVPIIRSNSFWMVLRKDIGKG